MKSEYEQAGPVITVPDLRRSWVAPGVLAVVLFLAAPRSGRAESSVQVKYEDYREEAGRIAVQAQYLAAELDLGTSTHLSAEGVVDTITGATPTGEPAAPGSEVVPLADLVEKRTGVVTSLTQSLSRGSFRLQYAHSREDDYISHGYSGLVTRDFNEKNTQLQAGLSFNDDTIIAPWWDADRKKRSYDVLIGITQLLDANTTLAVNLTHGWSRGYMSDPYKIVQKTVELAPGLTLPLTFPENRPDRRTKDILFVNTMHFFENLRASADISFRYYRDDFGIRSQTFETAWYQRIGTGLIVRPFVRLYRQNAADFYHPNLDATTINPVAEPDATMPHYSSDYRLAKFTGTTLGLKFIYTINERYAFDLCFERYAMKGRDGGATPAGAFIKANTFTGGFKVWF